MSVDLSKLVGLCAACGKEDPTKTCGRCKTTKYCSVECQREDWKAGHRRECVPVTAKAGNAKAKAGNAKAKPATAKPAANAGTGTCAGAGGAGGGGCCDNTGGVGTSSSAAPPKEPDAAAARAILDADGKLKVKDRQRFEYNGNLIYEWEQSMEECRIYVKPPPGVRAVHIDCKITASRVTLGITGNPPFLNEETFDKVVQKESYWMMSDGEIEINLQKMKKAQTWEAALKGHGKMDVFTKGEIQKKLTLERFQEEHPGFDFSGAEFSGQAPNPRDFMGGVKYQ